MSSWFVEFVFKKCRWVVLGDGHTSQKIYPLFSKRTGTTKEWTVWTGYGMEFTYIGLVSYHNNIWTSYSAPDDCCIGGYSQTRQEAEEVVLLHWHNQLT